VTARPGQAGERLVVGLVRGVHGLRGAVRVEVLTEEPGRFDVGRRLYREGGEAPLTVVWVQPDEQGLLVRFAEASDRDAAGRLRDAYLETVRAPEERLPRGRYWWHEVIGARVRDRAGRELGTVAELFHAGGAEVAVVRGERGEVLVPLVRAFVPRFAPRRGEIVVDTDALGYVEPAPRRPRGRRSSRRP